MTIGMNDEMTEHKQGLVDHVVDASFFDVHLVCLLYPLFCHLWGTTSSPLHLTGALHPAHSQWNVPC